MTRPLLQAYPALAAALPMIELAKLPTPLERAADAEGGFCAGELWIKRDDLSGERYGGNKVRKLEFLLADAQARGGHRILHRGRLERLLGPGHGGRPARDARDEPLAPPGQLVWCSRNGRGAPHCEPTSV